VGAKKRFIHHNIYFISWLIVSKNVTIKENNGNGYFIEDITSGEFISYKKEYKETYRNLIRDVTTKVKELTDKKRQVGR